MGPVPINLTNCCWPGSVHQADKGLVFWKWMKTGFSHQGDYEMKTLIVIALTTFGTANLAAASCGCKKIEGEKATTSLRTEVECDNSGQRQVIPGML